jgi:hypothetical protein
MSSFFRFFFPFENCLSHLSEGVGSPAENTQATCGIVGVGQMECSCRSFLMVARSQVRLWEHERH